MHQRQLGGDSIAVLSMAIHIENTMGQEIPLEQFFHCPTVRHLANLLAASHQSPHLPDLNAGLVAPISSARKQPLPRRIRERWLQGGPALGKHGLPYAAGFLLQRAWLAIPGIRRLFFRPEIEVLRRWGELVGEPHLEQVVQKSLLANTWTAWRNKVLRLPLGTSPWVTVQGDPCLWQPRLDQAGVIFLVMHSSLSTLFIHSLNARGAPPLFIRGYTGQGETRLHDRSVQVGHAYQALRRGATVVIAGDGGKGEKGVNVPFFAGTWKFRQGGAELAVRTGAHLVPVFCTMASTGQITIDVCTPLTTPESTTQTRVEALTRAYADLVIARWSQIYPSLGWGILKRRLAQAALEMPESG